MIYAFNPFELDDETGDLRKSGVRLKLGGQPRQALTLLLRRHGEVVTRDEIKRALWSEGVFTDFDHGVDTAIERARRALGDSARAPRFIETLPKRGYRFAAPIQVRSSRSSRPSPGARQLPRVAVAAFKAPAGDAAARLFAEELTEEIAMGLSQFRHLVVETSDGSGGSDARFLLAGSVRHAGSRLRVHVRLLDTLNGAHLWGDRLSYDLEETDALDAQDELTDRTVATVADPFGVLTRSLGALTKEKPADALTADECVLRWFSYWERVREEEHAELRAGLERALEREPSHADAWACLCFLYVDELRHDYNPLPDAANRALRAAQHAVEIDKTSPLAYRALAEAHFFRGETRAFRQAAERVLALNPRDTSNVGFMGTLIAYSGDWEVGCRLVSRAIMLNPHHGGWLHIVLALDQLRRREYELALAEAEQIQMPGYPWASGIQAILHAHLGQSEKARGHLANFLELAPDMRKNAKTEIEAWLRASPELAQSLIEGLSMAGLDFA